MSNPPSTDESLLGEIFHLTPVPMIVTSPGEGRIYDVNDAFASLFGYSRGELLDRTTVELGMWTDAAPRAAMVEELRTTGKSLGKEIEFKHRDGTSVFLIGAFVLTELRGRPCVVGVAEDITDRKRWEERAIQSSRLEAIGQLAGGVAHEFNNLLTVILGQTERMLDGRFPRARQASALQRIHSAATRAAHLTQQLLAFGRQQPLIPSRLDPNERIGELAELIQPLVGERIRLELDLDPQAKWIWMDALQLEQVLLDMALNARDAMPQGGTLTLRTSLLSGPESDGAREAINRSHVVLEVQDTGVGMPPEVQSRIFEPFFSTKEQGKGTGLGLSAVYGIIRQSGGSIQVVSKVGRGTTFRIQLPKVEAAAQSAEETPAAVH